MTDIPSRLTAALADRYVIERQLGEGGMATVYLATDVRHDRQVALKVLKPELGALVGGQRFLSEIRTTANLQHPHILPLFDSGEADGLIFYVMPYVEGESLKDRLERERQLPVKDAVRITSRVLAALEYAHAARVVHRDIKPANILMAGGEPLVADFGIALAVSQAGDGRITETGLTLGTPHYMSPEQATGERAVDPRSDLYSVACVLYEMLAGQPPFQAASAQAVLAKLLTEDPPDVRTHRSSVPEHVAAAVDTGLQRLPADRFQDARTFAQALESPGYSSGARSRHPGRASAGVHPGSARRVAGLVGWGLAAVFAVGWLMSADPPALPTAPPVLFTLPTEGGSVDFEARPALSPDESLVAFDVRSDGQRHLRIHRLGAGVGQSLQGTEGARGAFFSADGSRIGYFVDDAVLAVDLASGQVEVLTRDPAVGLFYQWGLWLDDGSLLLDHNETEDLWVLPAGESQPRRLARAGETDSLVAYNVSSTSARLPGGHGLVTGVDGQNRRVPLLVTPSTGRIRRLAGDGEEGVVLAAWADTVLLATPDTTALVLVRVDPERGVARRTGAPLLLPASWTPPSGIGPRMTASMSGDLEGAQSIVSVDRQGTRTPLDLPTSNWEYPRVSPSGDRLLLGEALRGERQVVLDLRTGALTPLPAAGEHTWGHDGRFVYWSELSTEEPEGWAIVRHRADGTGATEVVAPGLGQPPWVTSASPDGSTLLFYGDGIQELDLGTWQTRVLIDDQGIERNGMFSPDGRFIAYSASVAGQEVVYVKPYPELDRRWTISPGRGELPMWSPDGDELFYADGDRVYAVAMRISPEGELQPGPPELLFDQPFHRHASGDQSYDVAPDGSLVMIDGARTANVAVEVNWRSLLPPGSSPGTGG
ncbi:MAG: serine/threonine-protein kinase [Gemmatimonadales bacterium]|nr:MAG: serine/threonine-protein kinase [Gemmatimonadales bacterium]